VDEDAAAEIIECELTQRPRAEVFDGIVIPTLSRAERDHGHDEIDDQELAFVRRFVADLIGELAETPEISLETLVPVRADDEKRGGREPDENGAIVGVAVNGASDALALRMLEVLLASSGVRMTTIAEPEAPLKLAEQIASLAPRLVILSDLPPHAFTAVRYLVRRLRARFVDLPLMVGRWGPCGDTEGVTNRLGQMGASGVAFRLGDARDQVVKALRPKDDATSDSTKTAEVVPVPG
jgi:hypothetical protein